MSPRVCVVSSLYHPALGGLGRQAQLLSERLRREGVDLFVISRKMSGMPPADFSPDVAVIRVPVLFPGTFILEEVSLKNILISVSFSLGCIVELIRHRKKYDIVHFHGASIPLFLSLPFIKWMGKRIVAKVAAANLGTEAGSLSGKYGFIGDLLAKRMKKVDAFIAISDEIEKGLLRDGIPTDRIHSIANFIDDAIFYPPLPEEKNHLKARFGYAGKILALYAGRLVPRKGVEYLLEAWKQVSGEFPEARLLILGEGPLQETLEEKALRLGISETVRFGGRVDGVQKYLRAADLFVLPSLQEGMSNSLLEAMASGLPVVATRIGGVSDIVEDGRNGLLADPACFAGLAARLRDLISDPGLRDRIQREAVRTIREGYSLEYRVGNYLSLYEECFVTPARGRDL